MKYVLPFSYLYGSCIQINFCSNFSNLNDSMKSALTKLSSGSSLPESIEYDTDSLRKELIAVGYSPGPIGPTTKRVYLLKLKELKKSPAPIVNEHQKEHSK